MTSLTTMMMFFAGGAILGGVVAWLVASARGRALTETRLRQALQSAEASAAAQLRAAEGQAQTAMATVAELRRQGDEARVELGRVGQALQDQSAARAAAEARLDETARALNEQQRLLVDAETRMGDAFRSLAADALARNNDNFLTLAAQKLQAAQEQSSQDLSHRQREIEAVVNPVRETLNRVSEEITTLEKLRSEAYGRLTAQVDGLIQTQHRLENETANLVRALRAPAVRGRWGEIQLKRVVELAGMVEHCDFSQQVTLSGEDGRLRPDLVVRLPGGRHVVVDAKVPLEAYLDAVETQDEDLRKQRLNDHAAQVRAHMSKLSAKSYWEQISGSPEFVVLFLPGEALYSAALEAAPALLEDAVARRVLIATPTTLIALLQAVHVGWREERLAENAQKISEQGRTLHKNLVTFSEHWASLGKAIGRVTEQYNASVGSLERRVLPAARRLEEMGAGSQKELAEQLTLATRPRLVAALEGEGRGVGPRQDAGGAQDGDGEDTDSDRAHDPADRAPAEALEAAEASGPLRS